MMKWTVRQFVWVLVACSLVCGVGSGAQAASRDSRGYGGGKIGLELDGVFAGWLESYEGGGGTGNVVVEKAAPDQAPRKHIGGVKFEEITLSFGSGMSKVVYQWMKDAIERKNVPKSGAIIFADFNYNSSRRLTFRNALVSEVSFPVLDATAGKEHATFSLKIRPDFSQVIAMNAGGVGKTTSPMAHKKWSPSNFRLSIPGIETGRVAKIEGLTVKLLEREQPVGQYREQVKVPAGVEIPNLVVEVAEQGAQVFYDWHQDFVLRGNNGQEKERPGTLEMLTPDLRSVIFSINFSNLGIFKVTPSKVSGGNEAIQRVKAEIYCENMTFNYTNEASTP